MSRFYVAECSRCGEPDPYITYASYVCYDRKEARPDHIGAHFHVRCRRCGFGWAKRVSYPDQEPEAMSRDYINPDEVPGDVAASLRRIADAVEKIAEAPPRPPIAVIQLPADFTVGEAKEVVEKLQALIDKAGT